MASVAREAVVGIATLPHRFPAKAGLAAVVFADRMDAYFEAVATTQVQPRPVERLHRLHRGRLRDASGRLQLRRRPDHEPGAEALRPGAEYRRAVRRRTGS